MIGLGAYIGDFCGSEYEFKPYQGQYGAIPILSPECHYTDDSVMTTATIDWLIGGNNEEMDISNFYRSYGRSYTFAGYGHMFFEWIYKDNAPAYNSFGNGAGMRVSPVAFWANSMEECMELAEKTAICTHNHPEGIKGAKAIAAAIYCAKKGFGKDEIKSFVEEHFGYNLDRTVDEIKGTHRFDATCQVTVPEAIICFLESSNFEDCIRKSIWIGGDVDTISAMASPIAEAYYGIPYYLQEKILKRLETQMYNRLDVFNLKLQERIIGN